MLEHTLSSGKIRGAFTKIVICPLYHSNYEYLIGWNDTEVGVVLKIDQKWYAEAKALSAVVEEIGSVIDQNKDILYNDLYRRHRSMKVRHHELRIRI